MDRLENVLVSIEGHCTPPAIGYHRNYNAIFAILFDFAWNCFRTECRVCCSTNRLIAPMGFDLFLQSNKCVRVIVVRSDLEAPCNIKIRDHLNYYSVILSLCACACVCAHMILSILTCILHVSHPL